MKQNISKVYMTGIRTTGLLTLKIQNSFHFKYHLFKDIVTKLIIFKNHNFLFLNKTILVLLLTEIFLHAIH
jgi:hypothetical protein